MNGSRRHRPTGARAACRQGGHEVELGGPRVAHLDRARLDAAVDEVVVLAAQPLGDDVVDVVGMPPGSAATAGRSGRAAAAAAPGRGLDHESPAAAQMRRRVREARDLAVLRGQVEDRVEDEIDERELAVDARRRHVAGGRLDRSARASRAGGPAWPRSCRCRRRARRARRAGSRSGRCRANSRAAASPASSQHLDGRLDHGRVEHAGRVLSYTARRARRSTPLLPRAAVNPRRSAASKSAPARNRTWNLRIKSPLLCQLSYKGAASDCSGRAGYFSGVAVGVGVALAAPSWAAWSVACCFAPSSWPRSASRMSGSVSSSALSRREVALADLARLVGEGRERGVGARRVAVLRDDLLRRGGLVELAEAGVGLDHEAGDARVRALARELDVLVPGPAGGAELLGAGVGVVAGVLVDVLARVGEVEARAGDRGPGRGVGRVGARLRGRRRLLARGSGPCRRRRRCRPA